MGKPRKPKTTPISIRLTDAERDELTGRAGSRTLSDYIRACLFGIAAKARNAKTPAPAARDLAHILARLGASDLGPSLRELAYAAKIGALPVTPEIEGAIKSSCEAIVELRTELMRATGLREDGVP